MRASILATFSLALCLLPLSSHGSAAVPAKVMVCLDTPTLPSPSQWSACKTRNYGPKYNTDATRTLDPKTQNNIWVSWASIPASQQVCQLQTSGGCSWAKKSATGLNPPAPPSTTPSPPVTTPPTTTPYTKAQTLAWFPPTLNSDGSKLTDLAGFNIYATAPGLTTKSKLGSTAANVYTFTTPPEGVGTWTYYLTSFNKAGVESTPATATYTVVAPTNCSCPQTTTK